MIEITLAVFGPDAGQTEVQVGVDDEQIRAHGVTVEALWRRAEIELADARSLVGGLEPPRLECYGFPAWTGRYLR